MNQKLPHYLLYSQSAAAEEPGRWRFALHLPNGQQKLAVSDVEPNVAGQRLELLSVVRGLEALDQPCRVTLMTPSTYVREGIRYGLEEWAANDWRWESFGRMVPVANDDLWRRVARAMQFHRVECVIWRVDGPHSAWAGGPHRAGPSEVEPARRRWRLRLLRLWARSRRRVRAGLRELAQAAAICSW